MLVCPEVKTYRKKLNAGLMLMRPTGTMVSNVGISTRRALVWTAGQEIEMVSVCMPY